jgi:tRNA A37 threonylcarbamoyladenosine biosynthesis protein TsaE
MDDGGLPILDYELYMDSGDIESPTFTKVEAYDFATHNY